MGKDETKDEKINAESENNHVYFYSDVTRDTALDLITTLTQKEREMLELSCKYGIDHIPIFLHINSNGGGIFSCYSIVDTITSMTVPVTSIVEGMAASAATVISMSCKHRIIRKNAYMLIHALSDFFWGKYHELQDQQINNEKLMGQIYDFYTARSRLTRPELEEMLKHDLYFNAAECKRYGLVDEIR